jgi:hypothetical protein
VCPIAKGFVERIRDAIVIVLASKPPEGGTTHCHEDGNVLAGSFQADRQLCFQHATGPAGQAASTRYTESIGGDPAATIAADGGGGVAGGRAVFGVARPSTLVTITTERKNTRCSGVNRMKRSSRANRPSWMDMPLEVVNALIDKRLGTFCQVTLKTDQDSFEYTISAASGRTIKTGYAHQIHVWLELRCGWRYDTHADDVEGLLYEFEEILDIAGAFLRSSLSPPKVETPQTSGDRWSVPDSNMVMTFGRPVSLKERVPDFSVTSFSFSRRRAVAGR